MRRRHVAGFKDALLAEIRKSKVVFYNTVVAQAQKIEVTAERVTFTFSAAQRALRDMFEQNRAWLESLAQQVAGRKSRGDERQSDLDSAGRCRSASEDAPAADKKSALREQALADAGVQALLEVFPAEIRDVEEMSVKVSMNIQQMMKQAQQMQERLQKQMAELRVEGNAGGGMVTVVVNGAKQMQSLKIDPEVVSKDDVEMLQDLIVAAVNDAQRKADEEMSQKMGGMLPPGCKHCPGSSSSCSSLPDPARSAHRGAAAPARHRAEGRAAARVSHPQDAARAEPTAWSTRCAT